MWMVRVLLCLILLCVAGCRTSDPSECFSALRINFKSTSEIDSVHFYLNGERVCFETLVHSEGRCKNCLEVKGLMSENVICETLTEDSDYTVMSRNAEKEKQCTQSGNALKWVDYECFLSEKHYGKSLDSLVLQARVFSNETEMAIQPDIILRGGNRYNLMLEQDSAQWLGHARNVVDDVFFDFFDFTKTWQWEGCFDGFCVVTMPMVEKEVCYDK